MSIFTQSLALLYATLKFIVRIAIRIFCRRIVINQPALLKEKGPLLLACNHPNSFLDGIILDTLFEQPLYSLARGDAFKKPAFKKILEALHLLPVYRTSEGTENLSNNYETFQHCKDIFRNGGIVVIFSEGKCINEWHLRPLKKGTARLALSSWKDGIPLRVLPVGINYSSFTRFGKNVFIHFGEMIVSQHVDLTQPDGMLNQSFNDLLEKQLKELVYEIPRTDVAKQQQLLERKPGPLSFAFLSIPAALGLLVHAPLYIPIRDFTRRKTADNDHYDSVMTGILLFSYPLYLLLLTAILFTVWPSWYILFTWLLAPLSAWCYVQLKPQLDRSIKC